MPLLYPALALSLTVLSFIMLGDALRDALDPKPQAMTRRQEHHSLKPLSPATAPRDTDLAITFTTCKGTSRRSRTHGYHHAGRDRRHRGESGSASRPPPSRRLACFRERTGPADRYCSTARTSPMRTRSGSSNCEAPIGMVPQDPMSNLNPVWKIGFQVKETLRANGLPSGKKDVAKVARRGRPAGRGAPRQPVPARVLGRYASACTHRDRSVLRAAAAHRRRADVGPRRDRAAQILDHLDR